jgi:sugar/nucleoside kinase (ribokinase family)
MKFPFSHLMDSYKHLESARFIYASCYFLSSCREAMLEIAQYCTKTSKPFLLNLGAAFLVKHNFEDMMECIAHADYVFCN